jgi:two-component system KDP operon response regulator KdpE
VDALSTRPYVLVVEDEVDTRRTVERALQDIWLETVAVSDGAAALAQCLRRDPAVIVLDLALPGLDGPKLADAYRQIPRSRARIIVISGTHRGAETAAKMHADVYFSKPFRLDRLVEAASKLLNEMSATSEPTGTEHPGVTS